MKFPFLKSFAVMLIAFQVAGCSTMFGRQQDEQLVFFDSNIPGVDVNCSGRRTKTPGSIPLRQSKSHACSAELEGYERESFKIKSGLSWAGFIHSTAVNSALHGWITFGITTAVGWLIDFPSGAMNNLKEENIELDMKPVG